MTTFLDETDLDLGPDFVDEVGPTELIDMEDDDVAALPTYALRQLAEQHDVYSRRPSVAELPFTDEVWQVEGLIAVFENTLHGVALAYATGDPEIHVRHNRIEVTAWASDATLVNSLQYAASRLRRDRDGG